MPDIDNTGAAGASTGQAETPQAQRAALMADPAFRAGAMDPKGQQWAQLTALDAQIAGQHQAEVDALEAAAPGTQAHTQGVVDAHTSGDDDAAEAADAQDFFNAVPARPGLYQLPTDRARELGLKIDPKREIALRESFHAAGVPQSLAQTLYFAAVTAASRPGQTDASRAVNQAAEFTRSEAALRKDWGSAFETNLASANSEARRIFEKLSASITNGVSYADWCRSSGIANNRAVIAALYNRACARRS